MFTMHAAYYLLYAAVHAITAAVLLIASLLLGLITYRLFLHPLSRVPGPAVAAISNIWLAYQVREGRMLRLGKTLHRKYGPVVRVGPNEIWFHSKEACQAIYSKSLSYPPSNVCCQAPPNVMWLGVGNGYRKSDLYCG